MTQNKYTSAHPKTQKTESSVTLPHLLQGQKIEAPMREKYEQAFGAVFGGVRIHANTEADQLNRGRRYERRMQADRANVAHRGTQTNPLYLSASVKVSVGKIRRQMASCKPA